MAKEKKQSFLQGALVLVIANALIKVIGAIFKIPLDNLIGADGMGLFLVAYYLYNMMFVLSTAGLPVAVSRMVAEANALGKYTEVKRIFRVALILFMIIGAIGTGVMVIFAQPLVNMIGNSRAYYPVLAIAPSIFFVTIVSAIRGYFQGLSNMVPTAVSQVIEAACKLGIGYCAALWAIRSGMDLPMTARSELFRQFEEKNGALHCADLIQAAAQRGEPKRTHCDRVILECVDFVCKQINKE